MNVLYYLRVFPKLSESFVLNEIHTLNQLGHNVAVFALNSADEPLTHQEFEELDIPIRYADHPKYTDLPKTIFSRTLSRFLPKVYSKEISTKDNIGNAVWTEQCIEFIEQLDWEIDCLHSHFAIEYTFPCKYISSYYDVPFTLTTHAYDLYRDSGAHTGTLLESADRIITISEYNKKFINERFAPSTPIDVVYLGIRPDKFSPSDQVTDNRVLTVARLHEKKGVDVALEAIAIVAQEVPDVEYHIVGTGRQFEQLSQQVSELDIERNVEFLGNVSDEQLLAEYDQARCFLLPCVIAESGDRDGIPVSLMEAMAMRTPPVSTTISGIPELVDHGTNGLLTEPREPEATARAVLELLGNDSEWSDYADRSRNKVVDVFNVHEQVENLVASFEMARDSSAETPITKH
ncbi:glycosyltransferase [Halalkaliarchaeum sp. AArc-GB]|uniref:glycosyltransferase n=1 Tax=Halalkaliarchaeum sp. AArc-GB TaxID=3074078 RepID=UPI00285944D3|nr:glycosyltransferase [Halalkaliarchaeum sp. AArc-GB]MDR5672224.1 glycosyltransferase [Halalkaliarchaeum sp. AArc-GB]